MDMDQLHIYDRRGVLDRLRKLIDRKEEFEPEQVKRSCSREALKAIELWIEKENARLNEKEG